MDLTRDLADRTALVTGASRGLGRATAEALSAAGAEVVCVARDAAAVARVVRDINDAGGAARALPLDVTLADAGERLSEAAPRVDVLVHAAAAFAPYGRLEQLADDDLTRVLETSLGAAARLARQVLPGMRERGFGRLLFLGSLVASLGGHGQAIYAAAKAGLAGLVRSLAVEGGADGVTANLVELGLFDTERVREALSPAARAQLLARIPAGRVGRPAEAATLLAFLATPAAAYINGSVLPIHGGLGLGLGTPADTHQGGGV